MARTSYGLVPLLCALMALPAARAQDKPPPVPAPSRAERLIYDPATDSWIVATRPAPGTEEGDLDIARQWMAREDYKTALKIVNDWIKQYGSAAPRYPEALYVKATSLLELGEYRDAHDTYQQLLNNYPGSEYAERSLSAEFRLAEQYLAGKRRKAVWGLFRIKDREAGVKIMDDIAANYADTPLAELALKTKADYYFGRGDFDLAQDEYAAFAKEYPRSRYHPYALLQSARAALASFPGVQFDDAGLVEAEERYNQFTLQYPEVARQQAVAVTLEGIAATRAEKTYEIAWFYDRTGKKAAARYYYRATMTRWPGTPGAARAQSRLLALGEPETVPISAKRVERAPRRWGLSPSAAPVIVPAQPQQESGG